MASDGGIFSFGDAGYDGRCRACRRQDLQTVRPSGPRRIALYGDSLGMEAGPDFAYLARCELAASTLVRTYGGTCRLRLVLEHEPLTHASWQPTAVVLEFSGDAFTPCMAGDTIGTAAVLPEVRELTSRRRSTSSAPHGTEVFLVGVPYDA